MIRRLQLLDPESRSSERSVSAVIGRLRDGLLRDNKVVPAVLGVLALLIFAWLIAGALIGSSGDQEQQQASNQASLAQGEDSENGDTETPAPGVENRDSDASYGGYDEGPRDPFRQIIPKADEAGGDQNGRNGGQNGNEDDRESGDQTGGNDRDEDGEDAGDRVRGGTGGSDSRGSGDEGDGEDSIERRSPGDSGIRSTPGGGQGGDGQPGTNQGVPGQGGAGQGGGGGGLFNSGGDLPSP